MTEKRKNDELPTLQQLVAEKYEAVDPLRRVGCALLVSAALVFMLFVGLTMNWFLAEIGAVLIVCAVLVVIGLWLCGMTEFP